MRRVTEHSISIDPAEKRTRSDLQAECDINIILAGYRRTGQMQHLNTKQPNWGDFVGFPDSLQEAMAAVDAARDSFKALPAAIRDKCGNDPVTFLRLAADPEQLELMMNLGLPEQQIPNPAPPTSSPSSPSGGGSPSITTQPVA